MIITTIDEDELNFFQKQYLNVGDLRENIEELEKQEPKDKRQKDYKKWVDKIDFLYDLYNVKVGWKCYKNIGNGVRSRIPKKRNTGK